MISNISEVSREAAKHNHISIAPNLQTKAVTVKCEVTDTHSKIKTHLNPYLFNQGFDLLSQVVELLNQETGKERPTLVVEAQNRKH